MHTRRHLVAWTLLLVAAALGCEPEFDPINQVDDLRILAIGADTPELVPGESTTIRALVRAEPDAGAVSYAWDWCPFEGSSQDEYTCALEQSELDELASQLGVEAPQLVLGNTPEVEFRYDFGPLLQLYCELLIDFLGEEGADLPTGFTTPECNEKQSVTLRLIVTQPNGARVIAVKRIVLYYEAPDDLSVLNTNPSIQGVRIAPPGVDEEDALLLEEGVPFMVSYDNEYTLVLDVEDTTAEMYTPDDEDGETPEAKRENLLTTWYHESGAVEEGRKAYIDGTSDDFESLTTNAWIAPENSGDRAPGIINLYFVIQDEREGIGWTVRTLTLQE